MGRKATLEIMKKTTPNGHMAEADVIMMIMAMIMIIMTIMITEKKTPNDKTCCVMFYIQWLIADL